MVEIRTKFSSEDVNRSGHLEDLGVDGRTLLKLILMKCNGGVWTGLIWIGMGTNGGFLSTLC
jgi:hypothetical protein